MPLLAYNKTIAPLTLAAGNPTPPNLPASTVAGQRGRAVNVEFALRPNLTVDPAHGISGGLTAADFTALEAQRSGGDFDIEWTEDPVYLTGALVVGGPDPGLHAATHLPGAGDALATAIAGTIAVDDAAAVGTAASFSRSDHRHALPAPAAPAAVDKSVASAGASTNVARADHKHDVSTAVVGDIGIANAEGSATSLSRSDHTHNLPFTPVQTALAAASSGIGVNNQKITSLASPLIGTDAASKSYVDAVAQGLDPKQEARALGDANVASLSGPQLVGGVAVVAPNRVVLTAQLTATENGLWVVAAGAWTRPLDFATGSHAAGAFLFIAEGTHAEEGWICSTDAPTDVIDTDPLAFVKFANAPSLATVAPADVTKSAALVGVGVTAARVDHKHDVSTAAVSNITDSTNSEGSATSLSRSDHGHAHGNRSGGSLHALATTSAAGFMSASQVSSVASAMALLDEDIYLATTGNDANDGTVGSPVLTLARAQDLKAASRRKHVRLNFLAGSYAWPATGVLLLGGNPTGFNTVPEEWVGAAPTDQLGTRTSTAGTSATNAIDSTLVIPSITTASITAASGAGQARTMTLTGLTGFALVAGDVGSQLMVDLCTNNGNNGFFQIAAVLSGTSCTVLNAQGVVESTGLVYVQRSYRQAFCRFTNGTAAAQGGRAIVDHGVRATGSVTITGMPVDADTLTLSDGTASQIFEWDSGGGVTPGNVAIPFVGTETNAALAVLLRTAINGVAPSTLRIQSANTAGSTVVNMKYRLANGAGVAITKTGTWTPTLVGFTGGVGTSLSTMTVQSTGFSPAPTVGNTFAVEKPSVIITYGAGCEIHGALNANRWAVKDIKFQGTVSTAAMLGVSLATYFTGVEFDLGQGSWSFAIYSLSPGGIGSSFIADVGNPFTGTTAQFVMHNGTSQYQNNSSLAGLSVMDQVALTLTRGNGFPIIDGQRTTINMINGSLCNFLTTAPSRLRNTLLSTDVAPLIADTSTLISAQVFLIEDSPAYAIVLKNGANALVGPFSGFTNAKGIQVDRTSHMVIDNVTATTVTGAAGDFELGHNTVPNVRSYAAVRVVDGNGVKGISDEYGNRIDA